MSLIALPDAAATARFTWSLPSHTVALSASGSLVGWLVGAGALLSVPTLVAFAVLRCLGHLNLDTMTLLPAAACVGAAAMSLGLSLACWRALRDA